MEWQAHETSPRYIGMGGRLPPLVRAKTFNPIDRAIAAQYDHNRNASMGESALFCIEGVLGDCRDSSLIHPHPLFDRHTIFEGHS